LSGRWFTVRPRPAARIALVTDSGLKLRYPASWYGQMVGGEDALVSSAAIHSPTLATRETPATGALISIFDVPPARITDLQGSSGPTPPNLGRFDPSNEGIGAAYRRELVVCGHRVFVFVSLGDAASAATSRRALAVLDSISVDLPVSAAWIRTGGRE
jgi:hypothetical protein